MGVTEIDQSDFAVSIRRNVEGLVVGVGETDVRFHVRLGEDEGTGVVRIGFRRAADLGDVRPRATRSRAR